MYNSGRAEQDRAEQGRSGRLIALSNDSDNSHEENRDGAGMNFKNDGDGYVFVYMTNRKTVVAPYERRRWGVGSDRVDSND